MSWYSSIAAIISSGKGLAENLMGHKANGNQGQGDKILLGDSRDDVVLAQYSAGFAAHSSNGRWSSFVDGLNCLPRPIITISILGFLILGPLDPGRFSAAAQAYGLMPNGFWALLSVIIGFYFSGRMQLKAQDFAAKKNSIEAAKELVKIKREFRQLDTGLEKEESIIFDEAIVTNEPPKNKIIEQWLENKVKDE